MALPAETSEDSAPSLPSVSPSVPVVPTPVPAGPRPIPVAPHTELPETRRFRIKNRMLGPALHTDQLEHERLGKPTALAVFASDASRRRRTPREEILRRPACRWSALAAPSRYVMPITLAMVVRAGDPDVQLPPDDQGLPVGRRRVHRHQGQPRPAARPGRRRRPAHRLHPHRRGVGVGRRGRPVLGVRRRCTRTGCRSRSASSPSSPGATCAA